MHGEVSSLRNREWHGIIFTSGYFETTFSFENFEALTNAVITCGRISPSRLPGGCQKTSMQKLVHCADACMFNEQLITKLLLTCSLPVGLTCHDVSKFDD
jgi:hypothetical protein